MKHSLPYETRSAEPIETRDDDGDPIVTATAAVEELRTAVEQHRTATDQRLTTELRTLGERLDAIDIRTQRPSGAGERSDPEADLETRAFLGFVRRGSESLQADEVRALRVSTEEAGGYLAPEQFVAEIIRNLVEVSPIRQAARVGQATAGTVVIPKRTGRMTAQWVGETEDRPATEPAYGQARIEMQEAACYVDVSNWLLEDAAVDLAAELSFDFAEEFGRLEGQAFVNGTGVKQPLGIMGDPSVPAVANGHATNLNPDSLIRLMYDLPAYYRNRGAWLLNSTSIAGVRLFKDASGKYLWQESLAEGQPPTLLGRPVVEAVDMPDIEAAAAPIAYGDFSTAYRIYDRVNLAVLRDPYTMATKGLVRFHARRRVGAAVVQPEAIRKLTMTV
jgi:HK97 family phage major capsid protein